LLYCIVFKLFLVSIASCPCFNHCMDSLRWFKFGTFVLWILLKSWSLCKFIYGIITMHRLHARMIYLMFPTIWSTLGMIFCISLGYELICTFVLCGVHFTWLLNWHGYMLMISKQGKWNQFFLHYGNNIWKMWGHVNVFKKHLNFLISCNVDYQIVSSWQPWALSWALC
jgi:hypothetical protein